MASSITTFNGMRCTKVPRTQIFTTISTSAPTEIAGPPDILSSSSSISSASQPTTSTLTSSITALAATVISASSSTITAAATTATSTNIEPSPTHTSGDGQPTSDDSKKDIIAAAVGASVGAVAVVGLVILCAYLRQRKRRTLSTASRMDDGEKSGNRNTNARTGRFSGPTQPIGGLRHRLEVTLISPVMTTMRAVLNRLRGHRSTTEIMQHGEGLQSQSKIIENGIPATNQALFQNPETPHNIDPFADPPPNASATLNQSNPRSENPFIDPPEPPTWADDGHDIPTSLPLTVRNAELDRDNNNNNNTTTTRDRDTMQSRLSGSTLNLSNERASSPIFPEFKHGLANWRRDWTPEDRTSTYSDPFDLDRPPTIHSSAHPTPMVEQKTREGYFSEEYHNNPWHVS